jgi:hypothetical protein
MKTLLLGFALTLFCFTTFAQDQRTSFEQLAIVTTSAGNAVQLSWKKGTENISYFIVERSTDGVDFKQCGIVFLSEDPEFIEYKFRDKISSTTQGLLYRIGLVNEHKRLSYLPIKKLIAPNNL